MKQKTIYALNLTYSVSKYDDFWTDYQMMDKQIKP